MGAEQSAAGGGCCANRDHEAPRAPPRFYQLLTEPKRTVRRKSRKEASHKRIIAEIGYRKYQLGLVFAAYDVGGKGHLDLDELRTLAANMEGTDGQSKLMHATKEVKAMMRILNDGAGLTVSEGGFKTNMYTCLNVKVVQDRYFDQIVVKLRMSADSMMAAPDSDDSDGDDGDDDERRGRGGGGGASGAEVPESTEEGKGGSSDGGRGGEAGSSRSRGTVPCHIAHLRHQLKDVFEKYDMRDKDGKQDGKLLHEEVRKKGERGKGEGGVMGNGGRMER
jgi:hypothetical protein